MTTLAIILLSIAFFVVAYVVFRAAKAQHKQDMLMLVNRIRMYKLSYPNTIIDKDWERILKKYGPMYDEWSKSSIKHKQ